MPDKSSTLTCFYLPKERITGRFDRFRDIKHFTCAINPLSRFTRAIRYAKHRPLSVIILSRRVSINESRAKLCIVLPQKKKKRNLRSLVLIYLLFCYFYYSIFSSIFIIFHSRLFSIILLFGYLSLLFYYINLLFYYFAHIALVHKVNTACP